MTTSSRAGVTLADVTLPALAGGSSELRGVLGVPDGDGPWPGVVVLHEAYGVDEVMRRQVARLAQAGYLTLMPDLFSDGGALRCLVATFKAFSAGHGRAFVDIEAARTQLAALAECTGRVGVLGFCLGGGFALLSAARGFDVASVNYGRLPDDLDAALTGACPVVASYGGRDTPNKGVAARLETGLSRAGIDHDVREYPDAGHSFLNDAPNGPRVLRPVGRVLGVGPEPASAAEAWARIEAFFARYLH